jgi:hypothetical protein
MANANQTIDSVEVINQLLSEQIISDAPQVFPEAASCGDYIRQGDVYIWKRESVPKDFQLSKEPKAQVVPGDTKGSRHILDSMEGVKHYSPKSNSDVLQGPYLVLSETRTLTHPEHGHIQMGPGCYEITYQLVFAEERRRARD